MNDKKFLQLLGIVTVSVIIVIVFVQGKQNPMLYDLSPQSQHILQNYQNYLQTGKTSIPYNPSPIDFNQTADTNQYAYGAQQKYQQFLADQKAKFSIFGIPAIVIILFAIILIIIAVGISVVRR